MTATQQPTGHHDQHDHHGQGYRPPQDCPVCSSRLHTTRLGCSNCGTELSGHFRTCDFCALNDRDLDLLRVFLSSRGNMRDLERHLGVSYPTARARFDEVLGKLGLATPAAPKPEAAEPSGPEPSEPDSPAADPPQDGATPAEPAAAADPRLAALHALAAGELDVETAKRLIGE